MKSKLLVLCLVLLAFTIRADDPIDAVDDIYVINVTAGDCSTIVAKPRTIMSETEGYVKVQIQNRTRKYTDFLYLLPGMWTPVKNIVRVYRYTTGTVLTTCSVTDSTGTVRTGVKIAK